MERPMEEKKKIILKSGFQSGAELFRVETESDGLPKLVRVAVAQSNTYHDDGDDTQVVSVDFPAVAVHYGWNARWSRQWVEICFVGIDEVELNRPCIPAAGGAYWYVSHRDGDYTRSVRVKILREYLEGLAEGYRQYGEAPLPIFHAHRWTGMPFSCGDQEAAEFWRYRDGNVEVVSGVGDNTPYLADGEIRWLMQDRLTEEAELGAEVRAAFAVAHKAYTRHVNPLPMLRRVHPDLMFVFVRKDEDALVKMTSAGLKAGAGFAEADMGGGNRLCVFRA